MRGCCTVGSRADLHLPSTLLGFLLFLRRLFLAGLTQGLSGLPLRLRNFFLMLDSELWGPKGGRGTLSRAQSPRAPAVLPGNTTPCSTLTPQREGPSPPRHCSGSPSQRHPGLPPNAAPGSGVSQDR